jgi:hypothetical protein
MMRVIAIKELRETIGFAALALAVLVLFVLQLIEQGLRSTHIPFMNDGYFPMVGVVCWGLAVVLGLRQSAWERVRGTYPFLLHRPAPRRAMLAAKMITGLVLVELVALVPIVWYAIWASLPNRHISPFEWWMAEPAWSFWIALPVAYLGAFLSGIRPARWFGTRLLPLATGGALLVIVGFQSWPIALALSLVFSALLTGLVFYLAATSDFG